MDYDEDDEWMINILNFDEEPQWWFGDCFLFWIKTDDIFWYLMMIDGDE